MQKIGREELKKRIDSKEDFLLIEALPEDSYNTGHIPGALQMVPEKIRQGGANLPADKATPIVTYCGSAECPKSRMAAEALEEQGFTNVSAYEGGKKDWEGAGLLLSMEKAAGEQYHY
ncbi:MAG: rhodanese-like domain-containing protein [Micavibrio sp.]|nr:rhodanese-like domain-containing protein [Micavibrio sp.]